MSVPGVSVFDYDQVLPLGFRFPARMSVLSLEAGKLALVSPVPIDDALAKEIAALGRVEFLIAPNLLHHLYLEAAARRYPEARVIAPRRLGVKKPGLRIDVALDVAASDAGAPDAGAPDAGAPDALPSELAAAIEVVPIAGLPGLDELVLYHRATRTLVVTDLVFNITRPQGWLAHLVLFLMGVHGRLCTSRAVRALVKDRDAARASVERLLALPFESLVVAHGDVIERDAHARLEQALAWLSPARKTVALAASGAPR